MTMNLYAQVPSITGPITVCEGTTANLYTAPAGMTTYSWSIAGGGLITSALNIEAITVDWTATGIWDVSVTYTDPVNGPLLTPLILSVTVNPLPVPVLNVPVDSVTLLPATLTGGATPGQIYSTDPGMSDYQWVVSPAGIINGSATGDILTVDWTNVTGQQSISVSYTDLAGCTAAAPTVMTINYYPFPAAIDPASIPQFVDPLPHFAAGLRVNAKTGGPLLIKAVQVNQIALSSGTLVSTGFIGDSLTPDAGMGNYAAYAISTDNGTTFGPAMWPAQTIECQQGFPVTVQYRNDLFGVTYDRFNILADQTLMMNGYTLNGDPLTEPYNGPIPMVTHLHGGEMPSNSDGGPNAWFMPGYSQLGPAFAHNASDLSSYPNMQEATTLWYHPHDDGLTRINVYTGLAGYYFLRGIDEELANLPGWSGDDKVREITPAGKTPTFNGANTYLPEIEIGIQDRMFNVDGELYWPVAPPNPEIHPFWTPEFVGDIMVVNGKTWPYLSVAPRKYRFRFLEGCNARFLDMWLVNAADGTPGPVLHVVGGEGGLLGATASLDPAIGQTLVMAPGQRYDIIIDFTGYAPGTTFTLMNKAGAPYPDGDPVVPGITDRILQFIVNGEMVSAADTALPGLDLGILPANPRAVTPLVQLTDFSGGLMPGVTPEVHRQIILNEVMGPGGPAAVLVNNSYFDPLLSFAGDPYRAGGPTEFQLEGTTEKIQIINISADAHPIHIHLLQWQLVSRQAINDTAYLNAYAAAWAPRGIPEFPSGLGYPGGAGTPFPYDSLNADGAIGGNPPVSPFLLDPVIPANPEEMGWKDNIIVMPGQVTTFLVRVAPTDRPVNATPQELLFPFDPSLGPGYVVHCHIVDHEDMSMMRPLPILPSSLRYPQITVQPAPVTACVGDPVSFTVGASSATEITYAWQVSIDCVVWDSLADDPTYAGSTLATLNIIPAVGLSGNVYRCNLTNVDGTTTSDPAQLLVNNCSISGTLKYNNTGTEALSGFTVTVNGLSAITDASGGFTINNVTSGSHPVTITSPLAVGSINSTDAGTINSWALAPGNIPAVKYLSGDVDNTTIINAVDAQGVQDNFVKASPFVRPPWVYWNATGSGTTNPAPFNVAVNGASVTGFNILGMCTGDFNGSFSPNQAGTSNVTLTNSGITLTVPAGVAFNLPVNVSLASPGFQTGAISLVLNVPSSLVTVQNVMIPGAAGTVTFNTVGNELRIGWNSTTPLNVIPDQSLVVLSLLPTAAFTTTQVLTIGLVNNPLNEIADATFIPVINADLTVDNVMVSTKKNITNPGLKLSVAPNPVLTSISIAYQLPTAGLVRLGIYDINGTPVMMFLNGIYESAGNYTLTANVSALLPGTYSVNIALVVGTKTKISTIAFIKQ